MPAVTHAATWTDEVRQAVEQFARHMEIKELSRAAAARLLGVHSTTLARMLQGTYPGRAKAIARKMAHVLEREGQRRRVPAKLPFAETSITERVAATLEVAHVESDITLILGGTGTGKTVAARRYAEDAGEGSVLYIEAGPSATMQAVIRRLARAMDINWHHAAYDMRDDVAAALRGTGRLLIVDEMDYPKESALHTLRIIQEAAGIGMAWITTDGFLARLQKRRSTTVNQVLGRIGRVEHIKEASTADIEAVLAPYRLDGDCIDAVAANCHGEIRRACNLIREAQRRAGARITPQTIDAAALELMPKIQA